MTVNPKKYPWLSHWYEFTAANYDAGSKAFANLQTEFNRAPYLPVYDDGASGDPTFSSASGYEGMVLNNNATLSCRSMLLGEMTFCAVVEHTTTTGSQDIGLMGAGGATARDNNWAVYFSNGVPRNRQVNGLASAATFGGRSGPQLLSGIVDSHGRHLAASTNGQAFVDGVQLNRPNYYAQTSPELWIGDAFWTGIDSRFVGTVFAIYAGPVDLLRRRPERMASLMAEIKTTWGIA
ncbi:hypothetical protein [Sagittula sp. S175]|uniref:hypothetical protein n=1 Tax=Sagittula sp. S175 TaxID=3415129 RepID=UPI003C7D53B1